MNANQETKQCPECDGEGRVSVRHAPTGAPTEDRGSMICLACDGTGQVHVDYPNEPESGSDTARG